MTDTQKLLAEYVATGSEAAFRELVARYINFVYSIARRVAGEYPHLSEDVAQTVFINLARKAHTLSRGVMLGGWLHQHTYHLASNAVRTERRRQHREREAVEMNILENDFEPNLQKMEPILDEAITQLGPQDRTAILLRFFEQRSFPSVGAAMGSNEDAARMRVKRALEKLQVLLRRRGVTLPVSALASFLAARAVVAAPAGLALSASHAALASAAAASSAGIFFLKCMNLMPSKLGLGALAMAGAVTSLVLYHQSTLHSREANPSSGAQSSPPAVAARLRSMAAAPAAIGRAPRLPAPALKIAGPPPPPPESSEPNGLSPWLAAKTAKLAPSEVEPYLNANQRNIASLLAAFRATDDPLFLQEAIQKHPADPQVAFEAWIRTPPGSAERRHWLDTLEAAAPDNSLANYLSASDYLKSGHSDQAIKELIAASSKSQFDDYSLSRSQDDAEAYRAAGRSEGDAKLAANVNLRLPHLAQIRDLGRNIIDLANSYQQTGDDASRQAALHMAAHLGRRYSEASAGETIISQLVGINVERTALSAMDPKTPYTDVQSVQERLDQLAQQRTAIRDLNKQADPLWQNLSDQDWAGYIDRSRVFGEHRALSWLIAKYGSN